jgi:hypothetical protein
MKSMKMKTKDTKKTKKKNNNKIFNNTRERLCRLYLKDEGCDIDDKLSFFENYARTHKASQLEDVIVEARLLTENLKNKNPNKIFQDTYKDKMKEHYKTVTREDREQMFREYIDKEDQYLADKLVNSGKGYSYEKIYAETHEEEDVVELLKTYAMEKTQEDYKEEELSVSDQTDQTDQTDQQEDEENE